MARGFCEGCPVPENLAEYRNGKLGGGYFSDKNVCEPACSLVEAVAQTGECDEGPELEIVDDAGNEVARICRHSAYVALSQIGDAMENKGESPEVVIRIESKSREQ